MICKFDMYSFNQNFNFPLKLEIEGDVFMRFSKRHQSKLPLKSKAFVPYLTVLEQGPTSRQDLRDSEI